TEGDIENFIVKWAVDEKTFLAAVMYLKINGLDLVLRGAKGGILLVKVTRESRNFHIEDLENLDLEENQARIWQARVWDLLEHNIIGPNIDVPAGDIGVDAKVIAWEMEAVIRYFHLKTTEIHDAYPELARRLDVIEALRGNNKINGTLDSTKTPALEAMVQFQEEQQKDLQKKAEEDVGVDNVTSDMWAVPMPWLATFSSKPPKFGGLKGRDKATAEGAIDALIAVRKHQGLGASLKGVTFSVEGWGNASKYFIVGVLKRGARILAMNSSKMGLINDSFWEGKDDANFFDNIIRVYGDKYPLNKAWANSKINWSKNSIKVVNRNEAARAIRSVKIDYFVPAAIQGTVTSDNFQEIKATRGIVEISNGAILRDAEQRLIVENGINFVIPDVIANPGGVVVSILEHRGNMRGYHDTDEEVDEKRAKYVQNSVENTFRMQKKIKEISLRAAHNLVSEDIRSRSTLYKFMTEGFMLGKDGENNLDNKWNLEAMLKFLGYDQEDYRREEWNVLLEDFEKYITNKGFYKVGIEGREEEFNLGEVLIKAWNEAFIVKLENLMNKFVSHEVRKEIADELKNKLDLDFKINAYKTLKKMEYLLSVPDNNFFVEIQNFVSESSQEQSVSSPMTHNEDISEQLGILFQNLEESLHDVQIKLNAVQRGFSKGEGEDPFENFKAEMFDMAFGTFEELRTELLPGAKIPDKFLHFLNFIHYDSILEDGNPYGSDSYSLYYLWPVEQLLKSFMKTQVRVNGYNILDEWLMGRKDIASFENSIYLGTGSSPIGGINFNPDLLNLQIKRDGKGVPLPMWDQDWEMMENIQGFFPVIINVTPVMNFPMLLGLREEDFPNNDSANTCSDDGDSALCDERAIPINRWEEELAVM
ncbi:NADP-specific glutamate dehydrogenase, partial [hydrothermal vent metagenome]